MLEREIAVFAVIDIVDQNAYNNIVLRKTLGLYPELNSVQKAFITQLVKGTIRNIINLDYIINKFSKTPTKKMKPLILNTLRVSVYQLMYMDKVPVSAACNEAVKIVKSHGFKTLSGFVNGVLRNIVRNKENIDYPPQDSKEFLSIKYSYPMWIIDYWLSSYSIEKVKGMCIANSLAPKVTLCVNTNRISKPELANMLRQENLEVDENTNLPMSLNISKTNNISDTKAYKEGLFHIMDESSMLAVMCLDPKENSTVIDVCAAPGGKSFCCAYLIKNKGSIISRDIYEHKVKLISDSAERLGLSCISAEVKDALEYDEKRADYVIVDAPCSGLGLVRKKPDIKYNKTFDDIKALSQLQRDILKNASKMVKDNGFLLYSTCTVSALENIENVKWFCDNFDFECEDLTPYIPENIKFDTSDKGYIEILPDKMNSDGFFIARLRKK